MPMNRYLQDAYVAIESAIDGMSPEQMACHPEGKWCTAEIIEHLALAFGSTAKLMQRCVEAGKPSATKPSVRDRIIAGIVTGLGYIPGGRQAPKHTVPAGIKPQEARILVLVNLKAMDEAMQRCEEKFGKRAKLADHPVLGPLSLAEWRKFHRVHTRHHMKQIAQLRANTVVSNTVAAGIVR